MSCGRWLKELDLENNSEEILMPEKCILEMRAKDRRLVHSLLAVEEQPSLGPIMDCKEYSSINSLTTVGYLLDVFIKLWIPSMVRIFTYAWS